MDTKKIIEIICNYFKDKPIEKAWLFGSYARGEQTPTSDIDLLVNFSKSISLMTHAGFIVDLQELLDTSVDLVPEESLCPEIEPFVNKDKILIYERRN